MTEYPHNIPPPTCLDLITSSELGDDGVFLVYQVTSCPKPGHCWKVKLRKFEEQLGDSVTKISKYGFDPRANDSYKLLQWQVVGHLESFPEETTITRSVLHELVGKAYDIRKKGVMDTVSAMIEGNKAYDNDRYMYNCKTGRLASDTSFILRDRPVWFVSRYNDKELPLRDIDLLTSIEVNESDLPFDVMWDGEIVYTMNEPKLILADPLCTVYANKMVWNNPRKVSVTCEVVVIMNPVDRARLTYHNSVKHSFCLTNGIRYHYGPSNKCSV
jgi:hypothetical protein